VTTLDKAIQHCDGQALSLVLQDANGNGMTTEQSGPSAIVRHVYREHIEHFGEPDESIVFDDDHAVTHTPAQMPARIDVFVWHPGPELDITTFATIGMSYQPMAGAAHRAELHFAVRAKLPPSDVQACAVFLANLATYPFHTETHFDWWHKLNDPGNIPLFSNAKSVLLYPRFVEDGWDEIPHNGTVVKLLNVIPISAQAYKLKSKDELIDYVWDELGDPFAPW
jgi:hypothetical protein